MASRLIALFVENTIVVYLHTQVPRSYCLIRVTAEMRLILSEKGQL